MLVFGKRLRELRKEKGLTQQQLGDIVGVTKVSICCYENGTRTPTLETLVDLADALNTKITSLLAIDYFAVAEEDETKTLNVARDEIEIIRHMRNYSKIYEMMLNEPKRTLDYINQKIR